MRTSGAFAWGHKHTRAARLVADDRLTDRAIAQRCAIGVATLERWKQTAEFAERVAAYRAEIAAAELAAGIATRERRVAKMDRRHQLLEQVIEERAADPSLRGVPGGTTGIVVRTYKMLGSGPLARVEEEHAVDTGLLAALLAIEKQAAQELGQWTEKRELTGKDGEPLPPALGVVVYLPDNGRGDHDGVG
jgi:hypothetical protein